MRTQFPSIDILVGYTTAFIFCASSVIGPLVARATRSF